MKKKNIWLQHELELKLSSMLRAAHVLKMEFFRIWFDSKAFQLINDIPIYYLLAFVTSLEIKSTAIVVIVDIIMLPTKILCLVFVTLIHTSTSLPQGAPVSSCQNLLPVHPGGDGPVPPESTESLFRVEPQSAAVEQGQTLRIEIPSSIPRLAIKGFMIHARSTRDGRIVGRFAPSADGLTKLIDCAGPQDTATHSNTSPKTLFGLDWQAPSDFIGDIVFKLV